MNRIRNGVGACAIASALIALVVIGVAGVPAAAWASTQRRAHRVPEIHIISPATAIAYAGSPWSWEPYTVTTGIPAADIATGWKATALPPGVQLETTAYGAELSGTPVEAGSFSVTLSDSALSWPLNVPMPRAATQILEVTVIDGPPPNVAGTFAVATAPAPSGSSPPVVDYAVARAVTQFLGNDSEGDCVVAAAGHLLATQAASVGMQAILPSTPEMLRVYAQLTGGQSGPSTGVYVDAMLRMLATSGLAGQRIVGASQLADPTSRHDLEVAVDQLGGVLATVDLPSVETSGPWRYSPQSGGLDSGSHEVAVVGYNAVGPLLSTWGGLQRVTWSWWMHQAVAVDTIVPEAFVIAGHGPTGVPIAQLLSAYNGQFTAPSLVVPSLASAETGTSIDVAVEAPGYPAPAITASGMPSGMSFVDNGNGTATIVGNPTSPGNYSVSVAASNGIGSSALATIPITVDAAPVEQSGTTASTTLTPALSPPTLSVSSTSISATVGQPIDVPLTASAAVAWSAYNLPPGLTLVGNGSTAEITGTPAAPEDAGVGVTGVDAAGDSVSLSLTFHVSVAPSGGDP